MTTAEIKRVQELLNKTGGMLEPDGVLGPATRQAIRDACELAGVPVSDEVGDRLLRWLEKHPEPCPELPTEGVCFIAREEAGGRDYFESHTAFPHWPGEFSGVTIGVGYDLRFTVETFERDWGDKLGRREMSALREHLGLPGSAAAVAELDWIRISWGQAWQVFTGRTLPLQIDTTTRVYETIDRLPGLCRSVLVSLVFNRGPSITDDPGSDRRAEMRRIRDLLQAGRADAVADEILSMRRLWPNSRGLRERREREAELWRRGLAQG